MRMSELLNEVRNFSLDEGFSPREIKMAIGIASDPRFAKGNMTGAVTAIERMKKGLSKHPQVAAVLQRQNEDVKVEEAVSPTHKMPDGTVMKGKKHKDEKDEGNEFGLDEAPKMTYALVGTDMKIYAIDSDEKNMKLNRRSLEKRFKDVSPLKIARLKTAQSIGDTVDKSQLKEETLDEEVEIDEAMSMTDPKLLKMFDKLKSKDTVKIKYDSTLEKGTDFIEFTVKSKGTVRNGQVEKITLAAKGNPMAAKRFMYKKDGKVTFATGDMAASIVDIKESIKRALLKLESVNEMSYKPGSFKDTKPQEKGAKALADLAKDGGMDKKDFEKARALYVQSSDPKSRKKLRDFIQDLDTSPAEAVMDAIGRNDPDTFEKMYPDAKSGEFLSKISFRHRKIKNEEVEIDEAMSPFGKVLKKNKKLIDNDYDGLHKNYKAYVMIDDEDLGDLSTMESERIFISLKKNKGVAYPEGDITAFFKNEKDAEQFVKDMVFNRSLDRLDINLTALGRGIKQESIDEKYDLYHKDFSSAMQHAYSYAKSKMGITVDPKEIDSKVATGPKKPTEGKTNKYMLKGKGGNLQIQVYNKGGSKPFELNMYKEENALIAAAVEYLSND
jgi:hypothetical protein